MFGGDICGWCFACFADSNRFHEYIIYNNIYAFNFVFPMLCILECCSKLYSWRLRNVKYEIDLSHNLKDSLWNCWKKNKGISENNVCFLLLKLNFTLNPSDGDYFGLSAGSKSRQWDTSKATRNKWKPSWTMIVSSLA